MNVSEAIVTRKSIRAYLDKPVLTEDLEKIVEAGRWAPNAGPFQITVIRNLGLRQRINNRTHEAMAHSGDEFLEKMASMPEYQPLYGAPVLILLSAPADDLFSTHNAALVAENMLLAATELGLGSCYLASPNMALNGPDNRDLAHRAGIPDNHTVQCAVIVGYTADENKFSLGERTKKGQVHYID